MSTVSFKVQGEVPQLKPVELVVDGVVMGELTPSVYGGGRVSWMASLGLPAGKVVGSGYTHIIGHGNDHANAVAETIKCALRENARDRERIEAFAARLGLFVVANDPAASCENDTMTL